MHRIAPSCPRPIVFGLTLGTLLLLSPLAPAQTPAGRARPWGFEESDIPLNPRIHFGALANGVRTAWMANSEPKDRCYLRLHVNVGSFGEDDPEQGLAHFLEHMVFNGSKHYPAGTLVEWFQRQGMTFGGDTNASTNFGETTYQIDLPKSDDASMREGLQVLRDFADGALLESKEIDAEKGVIDAEERERDSAQFRLLKKTLAQQYAGTRVPERIPIGRKEVRDKFDPKIVRAFYERWYRPENFTLVAVGDFGERNVEGLLREAFENLKPPAGAVPPEPPLGTPKGVPTAYLVVEKEIPFAVANVSRMRPFHEKPRTWKSVVEALPVRAAREMLNLRLSELAKKKSAPFLQASSLDLRQISIQNGIRVWEGEGLIAVSQPADWDKALDRADRERRRAIDFGFAEEELAEVKANLLRSLDEDVKRESTRPSPGFVAELLRAAEAGTPPSTAEARRDVLKPAIQKLDLAACQKAFVEAWSDGQWLVSLSGNVDAGADGEKKLLAALEESRAKEVKPRAKETAKAFAYASDPAKAGKIAARSHDDALGFEHVVFENGVRLNVKKTDFQQKQVLWSAGVGEGELTLERPAQNALGMMGDGVYAEGGLGAHSVDELRRILAGVEAGASFNAVDDRFVLSGATTQEDLVRACEVACATLTDPGWRPEGIESWAKRIPVIYESMQHQHQGPITLEFEPELYSGEARRRFPKREELEAVTMDTVKGWLGAALKDAPVDVTVVGDLDVDATVKAVAQTFGALPKRRALASLDDRRTPAKLKTGLRREYVVDTEVPKTLVEVYFPATDGRDTATRRNLGLLADVLSDRLRVAIREKLGASYSPDAGAQLSDVFPGDGMIVIRAMAEPAHAKPLVESCLDVADGLAKSGVTDEELNRIVKPHLASIRDAERTNGHWLGVLARSHRKPEALDDEKTLAAFYGGVKPAALSALAKQYLPKERASTALVAPKAVAK